MPYETVNDYYNDQPAERQERLLRLHEMIVGMYPDATVSMRYKMPTFESNGNWIAIGNQKNYISVYTCSTQQIEAYCELHEEIKSGKGCLNFKDTDDLHLEDLRGVVHRAMTMQKVAR